MPQAVINARVNQIEKEITGWVSNRKFKSFDQAIQHYTEYANVSLGRTKEFATGIRDQLIKRSHAYNVEVQ